MGWFRSLWAGKDWGLDGGVGFGVGKWDLPFGNGNVSGIYFGWIDMREEGWRIGGGVGFCWGGNRDWGVEREIGGVPDEGLGLVFIIRRKILE